MNPSRFHKMADVRAKLKPLRPKSPRKIAVPLKVSPKSKRYMMVGTAFDYLLRFELQRLAPHAICERLVAEAAAHRIWPGPFLRDADPVRPIELFVHGEKIGEAPGYRWTPERLPEEIAKREAQRIGDIVQKAKVAIDAYVNMKEPGHSVLADIAGHAIRLAKADEFVRAGLDALVRAGQLDAGIDHADQEDVEDLLALLAIVPFEALTHPQIMLLNPSFWGADTDLITGDMLIDFKTTTANEIQADNLDQLFGYYLFARHRCRLEPTFPAINRLAIYFCRHGYLWTLNTTTWMDHEQFGETEEWFVNYFSLPMPRDAGAKSLKIN
jgi:hypothetical protein